jgi:hypothetical protein
MVTEIPAAAITAVTENITAFLLGCGWAVADAAEVAPQLADNVLAAAAPVIAAAERDRCIRLAVEHGAVYFAEPRPCTCKPGCAQVVSRVPFAPLLGGES